MKKTHFITMIMIALMFLTVSAAGATGCGSGDTTGAGGSLPSDAIEVADIAEDVETAQPAENDANTQSGETDMAAQPEEADETPQPEEADEAAQSGEEDTTAQPEEDTATSSTKAIVWLGDSLTQGSLGHKNDNLANAPYEKLKEYTDVPVEGYGFYGYRTHDILWVYTDSDHLNQTIDPDKTYIFWVGSCDWANDGDPNSDTAPVISDVDKFIADGNVKNYIMIGTTSRHILGDLYIPINADLQQHYGEHYMDVIDIINQYGYSEDNTHLSQESYDAIAEAVYEKLRSLGYIQNRK